MKKRKQSDFADSPVVFRRRYVYNARKRRNQQENDLDSKKAKLHLLKLYVMKGRKWQNKLGRIKKVNKLLADVGGQEIIPVSKVRIPAHHKQIREPGFKYLAQWIEAEKRELDSLDALNTFEDVDEDLMPVTALRTRFVYTVKSDNRIVTKFKARLIVRDDKEPFNEKELYAPTPNIDLLRMMLAIASREKMFLHQLDISNAFLNANIDNDIYVMVLGC